MIKERLDKHDRQLDRHERQLQRIRDLIEGGMVMVRADRIAIRALIAAQKRTEASLKAFLDSMRRSGGNGHSKRKVDLQ